MSAAAEPNTGRSRVRAPRPSKRLILCEDGNYPQSFTTTTPLKSN